MSTSPHFTTIRAAKDYLAQRIDEEAARVNDPLTDVERGMLYFTARRRVGRSAAINE